MEHTILVAGFDYRQKQLVPLLTEENWEYTLPKSEFVEEIDIDEPVYQYEPEEYDLHLEAEPDNPYDPRAVKVFAGDVFVGYVPRGEFDTIIKLSSKPNLRAYIRIIGGKYKYLEYDDEEDYLGTMESKYFKIKTDKVPVKAIMVFEW